MLEANVINCLYITKDYASVKDCFLSYFRAAIIYDKSIKLLSILSTAISTSFRRFHSREISRLRISDYTCLTILSRSSPLLSNVRAVRISISVRLKSLARMRHGDSLSGPTATRLLRMHRGRDDVMRLQRRKCNGSYIPSFPLAALGASVFICALHRPLFFLWPTLHLTVDRIMATILD